MGWLRRDRETPACAAPNAPPAAEAHDRRPRHASWAFEEGTAIAAGRRVLRSLGGGSRYEVFLVWDERLFALAVAKVLRPDHVSDPRALRDLHREAEVIERLAHPCLVRGFGAIFDGPHPHLLLEHVEGPTLQHLVKRYGPLPLHQLLPLALHVLAVLHYLSAERIVHLDVKPGNIVMSVPPRLIDLSIARTFESALGLRDRIGTDRYMAPEQCDPGGPLGPVGSPADVWALGATLHHAASGEVPFPRPRGASDSADPSVRFPQLVGEPAPLVDVPSPFAEIVLRMLARRPEERPTPAEVAAALEPLVAAVPDRLAFSQRRGLVAP